MYIKFGWVIFSGLENRVFPKYRIFSHNTKFSVANNANLFYPVTANQIFRRMTGIQGICVN